MTLHLLKLCVGVETIDDLQEHIHRRLSTAASAGVPAEQVHTTRMVPKRVPELLDGGSLYWVIKGNIQVRQKLLEIRPFTDGEGISRCHLVLEPALHPTLWQQRRPFQGWRYLNVDDAPRDVTDEDGDIRDLPPEMRRELASLGLL
ncbi:DUF1489 family protein [Pararhizobium haloflavum]|uniref:DUF1489 family protein n=1 Tax=Pararhizobium haloflavum TaxID=2037914 RepID=UPI000C17E706|nr:DUF1489 family protein [Pararhizobium haloflavum]